MLFGPKIKAMRTEKERPARFRLAYRAYRDNERQKVIDPCATVHMHRYMLHLLVDSITVI